jgi:hypothetical protein
MNNTAERGFQIRSSSSFGQEVGWSDGWKREWQSRIVVHGGRGFGANQHRIGFDNRTLCSFNRLRHARRPY